MSEIAVFGGGCFWCLEALFTLVRGVIEVRPGYAGGELDYPTYDQVSRGHTGHAEVVEVRYNPAEIDYRILVTLFFYMHDPTTPDRQGHDVGPQYRSIILFTSSEQEKIAQAVRGEISELRIWGDAPLVTEILPLKKFWPAEVEHRDYYKRNSGQAYCRLVIAPKIAAFKKKYPQWIIRH